MEMITLIDPDLTSPSLDLICCLYQFQLEKKSQVQQQTCLYKLTWLDEEIICSMFQSGFI